MLETCFDRPVQAVWILAFCSIASSPAAASDGAAPLEIARQTDFRGFFRGIAVHPRGRMIAMGTIGAPITWWDGPSAKLIRTTERFGSPAEALAFTRDGGELIAAHADGTLAAWGVSDGVRRFVATGHAGRITSLALDPTGARVASGGEDGKLVIWELARGKIVSSIEAARAPVWSLAWSPSGDRVATGSDDARVRVWDAASGQRAVELEGHTNRVVALHFAGAERLVSGAWDDSVRVWDLQRRTSEVLVWEVPLKESFELSESALVRRWGSHTRAAGYRARLVGHVERAIDARFEGGVLTSIGDDDSVKRWNLETGALTFSFGGTFESGQPFLLSPDGRAVVSRRSDGVHILWNLYGQTGRKIWEGREEVFAFSADGAVLLIGATEGTVRAISVADGARGPEARAHAKAVRQIITLRSGVVTRGEEGEVKMWSAALTQPRKLAANAYVVALAAGADGSIFGADVRGNLIAWSGEKVWELSGLPSTRRIWVGDRYLAAVDESRTARFVDLEKRAVIATVPKISRHLVPIYFSGGDRVWIAHEDGPGEIRELGGGAPKMLGRVTGFARAGDFVVALAEDGSLGVHRPDGTFVRRLSGASSWLSALACAEQICASAHGDGSVRAFDPLGARKLWRTRACSDAAVTVAISPDGTRVAAGGWDGAAVVFDGASGRVLHRWAQKAPIEALAFEPGGRWIVAGDDDRRVLRADVASGLELPALAVVESWSDAAAVSEDGCTGVSAVPGGARVWDLCTARSRAMIGLPADVSAVAVHGELIALGDASGTLRLVTRDGAARFEAKLFARAVATIAFSADGKLLAAGETSFRDRIHVLETAGPTSFAYVERGRLSSRLCGAGTLSIGSAAKEKYSPGDRTMRCGLASWRKFPAPVRSDFRYFPWSPAKIFWPPVGSKKRYFSSTPRGSPRESWAGTRNRCSWR